MKRKVGLRISVGAFMLLIFCYYLVTDPQFRSEFGWNPTTICLLGFIGAFVLPSKLAWLFQLGIAVTIVVSMLLPHQAPKVEGGEFVGYILAAAMLLLGIFTFREGWIPAKRSETPAE